MAKNFKHWYSLEMIGRHFLLYSKEHITVKRQYTICNAIEPKLYTALLTACEQKFNGAPQSFDHATLL